MRKNFPKTLALVSLAVCSLFCFAYMQWIGCLEFNSELSEKTIEFVGDREWVAPDIEFVQHMISLVRDIITVVS